MASVYAATHRNGKRVAVKILNPELNAYPEVRARFLREGYVANKVGHPGAVSVDDDDVASDGAAFLVMELLDGETLEALRERSPGGRLPAHEVAALMDQVLDTLSAAHAQGIVHRDLKPENMFLTRDGVVKLLDFGIARLREGSGDAKTATATGTLMGTPAYLSPEQARGRWSEVDGRSDLWSAGATMFALLAGRCVHQAETANEVFGLAMMQAAPALRSVAPDVPAEIAALVDRALAPERDARWPDARAMQRALRAVAAGCAPTLVVPASKAVVERAPTPDAAAPAASHATAPALTSSAPAPRETSARRIGLGVALTGVAGVVAAAAVAAWPRSGAPAPPAAAEPPLSAAPVVSAAAAATAPPSVAPAATSVSVTDLPDVVAATASATAPRARPRAKAAPPPAPASAKPSAAGPADPLSARKW
jgi:serine/threonine-protein kinase